MALSNNKIGWIVPALAVALVAGVSTGRYFAAPTTPQDADFAAAVPTQDTAPQTEGEQVVALLESVTADAQAAEVTRTTSVDLLGTAASTPIAPAPAPIAAAQPAPAPKTDPITADFFSNAQANLAAEGACGEDLRALAADARVYFPTGGLSAGDAGLATARLIGQVLKDCPGYSVQVIGHSDASGSPGFNQTLSERRANTVMSRLAASGIDTSDFVALGVGDTQPSGVTGPEDDAFYDRRVEFSIVENVRQASLNTSVQPWQTTSTPSNCVAALQEKVAQTRIFYTPRAITVSPSEMEAVKALAAETMRCDGARLRLVGQHSDKPGSREDVGTGRLRVLAMMSSLVAAGYDGEKILIGSPSYSVDLVGQPGLPNSRVDFQIITD